MRESLGRWELQLDEAFSVAFTRFPCILLSSFHQAFLSFSLSFTLAGHFSSLSLSLLTLLIQNPSMNLSSLQCTDDLSSLPPPSASFSCLSVRISIPSPLGEPADELSMHYNITLLLFFTGLPPCSHKFPLNCSPILQMNCLNNSIFLLPIQESGGAGEDLADNWRRIPTGSLISARKSFYVL